MSARIGLAAFCSSVEVPSGITLRPGSERSLWMKLLIRAIAFLSAFNDCFRRALASKSPEPVAETPSHEKAVAIKAGQP